MVRHGRTAWNAAGRFQGHSDVPLSPEGIAEADAAARALAPTRFAGIVSSDLSRAAETASRIARGRDVRVEHDVRLREIAFGKWEGLTWAEITEQFPEASIGNWHDPRGYVPHGGESFDGVKTRVACVLDELRDRPGIWCVVAHAGAIHAALSVLFGPDSRLQGLRLDSGSISRVYFTGGRAEIVTLNDIAHRAVF